MDVGRFFRQSSVVIVVGKGGVGKTTVTAVLAETAARAGLEVLLVTLDDSADVPRLFESEASLGYDEIVLVPGEQDTADSSVRRAAIRGQLITADAALTDYLAGHGLGRVSRRLLSSGVLDVVATAIPGVREVLVLGKLKQLERANAADLILLDAPATGHAFTFLTSSGGLRDAARGGPLRTQAEQVIELLGDPSRCSVALVTVPEETPVNELIESAYRLEDEVGVMLGPVVVNGCYRTLHQLDTPPLVAAGEVGRLPPSPDEQRRLAAAAAFRHARQDLQDAQLERLDKALPLPQLRLPHLFSSPIARPELGILADALEAAIGSLP